MKGRSSMQRRSSGFVRIALPAARAVTLASAASIGPEGPVAFASPFRHRSETSHQAMGYGQRVTGPRHAGSRVLPALSPGDVRFPRRLLRLSRSPPRYLTQPRTARANVEIAPIQPESRKLI